MKDMTRIKNTNKDIGFRNIGVSLAPVMEE